MANQFNVRVYGLLINEQKQILVTDEKYGAQYFTKFPGGGLEFGEGTIECLIREFKEELKLEISVLEHFYTTDFFQKSVFNPELQIISIYYLVKSNHALYAPVQLDTQNITSNDYEVELPRWIPLSGLSENTVTFPIDKLVVNQLIKKLS